ncbi:6-bladed beta-propeller [Candidatus Palauibacter sp.]|uniref:6-bladed beta-propeller n=2 Tax=Candidatus Palauibacter sp. TaxID=3101350 RepID=UPI003AF205A9
MSQLRRKPRTTVGAPLALFFGFCIGCSLSSSQLIAQQFQFDLGFPLVLEDVSIRGAEEDLGVLMDSALGPDGFVYVADVSSMQIIAFDPNGDVAWKSGRQGEGPGEFRGLYRITVGADGTIHAFDRATSSISRLTSDGSFVDRRRLEFAFPAMNDLVATADGRVAVSGITSYGFPTDSAVHVFDSELAYVRSFAPAPTAENSLALTYSGAGTVALTPAGDVLFVRRIPYEVYHYSLAGARLNGVIEAPFEYDFTADDVVTIEERAGRIEISRPQTEFPFFSAAVALTDSTFLVPRRQGESRHWDFFTTTGRYLGSTSIPSDWGVLIGYDSERRVLWARGEQKLEPVLRRLEVELRGR